MVVECDVAPLVAKVSVIDEYNVPDVVEYLHVAFSFVVTESVVDVVPDDRVLVGAPFDSVGGVVSVGALYSSSSVVEVQPGSSG